jgi:hypothetical protein
MLESMKVACQIHHLDTVDVLPLVADFLFCQNQRPGGII